MSYFQYHVINVILAMSYCQCRIINVILLTTQYAGYGIDINYATDVIIFHSMAVDKQQAIGRAQRVGRTNNLIVHNLCFEHELEEINQAVAI
jgi:SNF2 family DNA or RNA helicase